MGELTVAKRKFDKTGKIIDSMTDQELINFLEEVGFEVYELEEGETDPNAALVHLIQGDDELADAVSEEWYSFTVDVDRDPSASWSWLDLSSGGNESADHRTQLSDGSEILETLGEILLSQSQILKVESAEIVKADEYDLQTGPSDQWDILIDGQAGSGFDGLSVMRDEAA